MVHDSLDHSIYSSFHRWDDPRLYQWAMTLLSSWYQFINWYQLISTDINWYQPISTDMKWYQLIWTDINRYQLRYQLISVDISSYQLISFHISWYRLISVDISWYPFKNDESTQAKKPPTDAMGFVQSRNDSIARLSVWLTYHHGLQLLPLRYVTWTSSMGNFAGATIGKQQKCTCAMVKTLFF